MATFRGTCTCPVCQNLTRVRVGGYAWPRFPAGGGSNPGGWLPLETSEVPFLALRAARLRTPWLRGSTDYFGAAIAEHGWFGVEAEAECKVLGMIGTRHERCPDLSCHCGFYAVPPDLKPPYSGTEIVHLEVELAGRVIVHSRGYRAGWQRVLKVRVPACPTCRRKIGHVRDRGTDGLAFVCRPCFRKTLGKAAYKQLERDLMGVETALDSLVVPWELEGRK